LVNKRIS